jgi:glycosyltransferase involved in cell wall biosynthesis
VARSAAPDVVHFQHLLHFTPAAVLACARAGYPCLLTLHDPWLVCEQPHLLRADLRLCPGPSGPQECAACMREYNPAAAPLEQLAAEFEGRRQLITAVLKIVDTLISPTRYLARLLESQGLSHPRLVIQALGLEPVRRAPVVARGQDLRLGCIGQISRAKGTDLAIAAMSDLFEEPAELRLHGMLREPALLSLLSARARVSYRGSYGPADLPRILGETDVAVLPSRTENFPTVVRECLSAGVPVIASDVGGTREIIEHGVNGLLVPRGDAGALRETLRSVIRCPALAGDPLRRPRAVTSSDEEAAALVELYRAARQRRRTA